MNLYFLWGAILILMLAVFYFIARNIYQRQGVNIQDYYTSIKNLSNYFPGKISASFRFFLSQPSFQGNFAGHRFSLTFWRSEVIGVPPTALILTCHITNAKKLSIFMYDNDPGTVLFAKRIYTGDIDLDKYFIYSNKPDEAKEFFHVSRKAAIKDIIQKGWTPPHITANQIQTQISITKPEVDPDFIKETLKMMAVLHC
jgi:hypothetical protein